MKVRTDSLSDDAQRSEGVVRKPGGRVIAVLVSVGVFAVFIGGVVWTSMEQAPTPHYQRRVTMPNMASHPVSLWLGPQPHRTGQAQLTAQVADATGSPLALNSLDFSVTAPGQNQAVTLQGEYTPEGPLQDFLGNSPAYSVPIHLTTAGTWLIEVRFIMGGTEQQTLFQVEVRE